MGATNERKLGKTMMSSSKKKKEKTAARQNKAAENKTSPALSFSLSLCWPSTRRRNAPFAFQSTDSTSSSFSLSLSNSRSPQKNETRNRTRYLSAGPRQKVGVDAADGQRQARVQVGARQDGRHRAGHRRVGQGQGRRDIQGAAQDGAGGGRGGERQGREEERSSFGVFFSFLFLFFVPPFQPLPFSRAKPCSKSPAVSTTKQHQQIDQDRPAQVQGRDGPPRADRVPDPLVQRDGLLEGEGGPVEDRAQDGR